MSRYKLGTPADVSLFTSIQTMRGCPVKCISALPEALKTTEACALSAIGRQRMKQVVEIFGTQHFYIVDDVMMTPGKITFYRFVTSSIRKVADYLRRQHKGQSHWKNT